MAESETKPPQGVTVPLQKGERAKVILGMEGLLDTFDDWLKVPKCQHRDFF